MESYFPLKLKRKDLEDVSDDFSEFSLSSPARKIRRLDADLPPIIEEEECELPLMYETSLPNEQSFSNSNYSGSVKLEELPSEPSDEDRAIVLFKPMNTNLLAHSRPNFSVDPSLVSGFKNQVLWSSQSRSWRQTDDEASENEGTGSCNGCLAVVPWVPSQLLSAHISESESPPQMNNSEMTDAQEEEEEETTMEVEDGVGADQMNVAGPLNGMALSQQFHQWQQQHCLIPQPLHNSMSPIVWYQ